MKIIANLFSYLMHPLFIICYVFMLCVYTNPYAFGSTSFTNAMEMYDVFLIQIFISTVFLPAFAVFLMKYLGMIDTFKMKDKQERIGPYIATGIFYTWIFMNFRSNPNLPTDFKVFVLGATLALFICFFINNFSKISMHTTAMGGLLAFIVMGLISSTLSNHLMVAQIVVILIGIVGTSRLILGAHRPTDIYGGYLVGFVAQFIALQLIQTSLFGG